MLMDADFALLTPWRSADNSFLRSSDDIQPPCQFAIMQMHHVREFGHCIAYCHKSNLPKNGDATRMPNDGPRLLLHDAATLVLPTLIVHSPFGPFDC